LPDSVNIHLKIISGENSLYDNDISTVACDSDNDSETAETVTAYCAILQSGLSSNWNWDWAPGAFVNSIGDITGYTTKDKDNKDIYHYWSWSLNGVYGETGLNQYELKPNDSILLEFVPVEEVETIPEPEPEVVAPSSSGSSGHSHSSSSSPIKREFSLSNALSFLLINQKVDGSFSGDMYTDWGAVAVAQAGDGAEPLKKKIYNYLLNQNFTANVFMDNERHAMALMALGINPYSGTKINYIEKIVKSFDGQQIGDVSNYNDDIFGLIVFQNAGYTKDDEIISKTISNIISQQSSDGSWGGVDMTSAGIMALENFEEVDGVKNTITKGFEYLISQQKIDGGFENSFSTSWATQALSLNNSYEEQLNKAIDYLAEQQQDDGGVNIYSDLIENRVWATAYVIPAVLKLSWNDILNDFPKQEIVVPPKQCLGEEEKKIEKISQPVKITKKTKEIKPVFSEETEEKIIPANNLQTSVASVPQADFLSSPKIILLVSIILGLIAGTFVFKRKV
jgi:hypothetical protein